MPVNAVIDQMKENEMVFTYLKKYFTYLPEEIVVLYSQLFRIVFFLSTNYLTTFFQLRFLSTYEDSSKRTED